MDTLNQNWVFDPTTGAQAVATFANGEPQEYYIVSYDEMVKMNHIIIAASVLEAFLSKCSGTTADYPVDIVARDTSAGSILAHILSDLSRSIYACGRQSEFDASKIIPPPETK